MAYCRHDMPADTCALCAPRRPATIHLVACGDYDEGPRRQARSPTATPSNASTPRHSKQEPTSCS